MQFKICSIIGKYFYPLWATFREKKEFNADKLALTVTCWFLPIEYPFDQIYVSF
jgi:hypothetical protein